MRLKQYLTELSFKAPLVSYKVTKATEDNFMTKFETDSNTYIFHAIIRIINMKWVVEFYRYQEIGSPLFDPAGDTSKEETIQVFSGVRKSLEEWVKRYKPDYFEFTAEDIKHGKLYDVMSKYITKQSHYKLDRDTYSKYGYKTYRFTK